MEKFRYLFTKENALWACLIAMFLILAVAAYKADPRRTPTAFEGTASNDDYPSLAELRSDRRTYLVCLVLLAGLGGFNYWRSRRS